MCLPVSPCRDVFAQIITIDTLFYLKNEGAGVRDAFPPPMCVG